VDVFLTNGSAELESATELAVLNGANICYIGGELIYFKVANMTGPRQYRLSGFLRGIKGTEDYFTKHKAGDQFILLNPKTITAERIDSSRIGQVLNYKGVTNLTLVDDAKPITMTFTGRNVTPIAPVAVLAYKDGSTVSSDWKFNWTRRTRTGGEWRDRVDASFDDPQADIKYDIEILDLPNPFPDLTGATVKRTISNLTDPSDVANIYTAAQQVTDFGSATSNIVIKIYQKNSIVGRGIGTVAQQFTYHPIVLS